MYSGVTGSTQVEKSIEKQANNHQFPSLRRVKKCMERIFRKIMSNMFYFII